jgi:hypothetical protein
VTLARRIPPELFKETIAPLLLVEHTALIGITTPMEAGCDYSMMMDLKHENGDPMFNAISVSLICEACRKNNQLECPHNEHEIPHWKRDKKRSKLVQSIMQGDKTMYLRENAGVVTQNENHAFILSGVDALVRTAFETSHMNNVRAPVFVCIDTAGGGASCTAICSGIYTTNHTLLVRYMFK